MYEMFAFHRTLWFNLPISYTYKKITEKGGSGITGAVLEFFKLF